MVKFFVILAAILNAIMITFGIALIAVGEQAGIGVILVLVGIPIVFLLRKKLMQLNQLKSDPNAAIATTVAVGMGTLGNEDFSDSSDADFGE